MSNMASLYAGTSGFAYPSWKPDFYPPKLPAKDFLKHYAARLNAAIRQHWGIENKLHWVLDVGFGEDRSRKRAGHAAQNYSILTRIALNLLKTRQNMQTRHPRKTAAGRLGP